MAKRLQEASLAQVGALMIVSPQIERLLSRAEGFERTRRMSLVRRLVLQALKGEPNLDLNRNVPKTVNAIDESGTGYNATNVVEEFKRQAALSAQADAAFKKRAPKTIEVRRHIKKLLRGLPQQARETIAALVAFEIEQRGGDVSRKSVAEQVEVMRRQKPKLFVVPALYEPENAEGV